EQCKKEENIGLLGGKTGIAFFFFYYAKLINKQEPYDHGLELLSSVFESINKGYNYHTHGGGLAGIGSVIELLSKHDFLEADTNELLGGLDEYLYKSMIYEIENENYDFLHGAVGIGFYFLKRKTNKNSKRYLTEFVDELDKIATKDELGIRWISVLDREKQTKGFNLSLSHGLASIIAILSKIYSEGIEKDRTLELLEGSVKYLLNQQQDIPTNESNFPSWVCETEPSTNSRLAWCYGDLGIGIALWVAGNNTGSDEWKSKAVEILLHTTKRKSNSESGVNDTGICHGSAGIAHIYNRMYNYTGIEEFKDSATFWFNRTLDMATHKDTFSGFKAFRTEQYGGPYEDFGFLEGVAGIGLTLISAISDIEPVWDECLLLS
ncbi:lanthionine synthetase C family protein, partial [Bacteroidota bacterium]